MLPQAGGLDLNIYSMRQLQSEKSHPSSLTTTTGENLRVLDHSGIRSAWHSCLWACEAP